MCHKFHNVCMYAFNITTQYDEHLWVQVITHVSMSTVTAYQSCCTNIPYAGISQSLFFLKFPKFFTHYSYFILTSSPIILTYSCNFYCICDNNVHNTDSHYYTGEQDVASADFSSQSTWNIAVVLCIFTIIIISNHLFKIISLHLRTTVTSNYSCIMLLNVL